MRIPVRLGIAFSLSLVMIASAGLSAATSGSKPAPLPAEANGANSGSRGGDSMLGGPLVGGPSDVAIAPEPPCGETVGSGSGPDASVGYTPCPNQEPTDLVGHPQDVTPTPGMDDMGPVVWTKAVIGTDERTLTIRFWSGIEPCSVLDHVDVAYDPGAVTVTLFQGSAPSAQVVACAEIAVLKQTMITLAQPLAGRPIVDGARA